MKSSVLGATAFIVASLSSVAAWAQGSGVSIQASATTQTALAVGVGNRSENLDASTSAGTHVGGHFSATTSVPSETAIALGADATASNVIASVSSGGTGGDARLTAITGQVTTLAVGFGASACTSIASVNRPTGSFGSVVATGDIVNVGIGGLWNGHVTVGSTSPC